MRKKIVLAALTAGTIGLSGVAVAGPALASGTHSSHTTRSTAGTHGSHGTGSTAATGTDAVTTTLAGLVTDNTLTQAQADKVAAALTAAGIGGHGRPGQEPGGSGGDGARGGDLDLSTAATTLGLSEADLRTALQSGKTLAQVAQTRNVAVDTLITALVNAETIRITADVTAGRLTQAEANKRLADLSTRVTERVNNTRPARPNGPQDRPDSSTPATTAPPAGA